MVVYITIIIISIVKYITEAFHDRQMEKMFINSYQLPIVKRWHQYDFINHILGVGMLSFIFFKWSESIQIEQSIINSCLLMINIAFIRMLTLNTTLNLIRGRQAWYLGYTSWIDIMLKRYEKIVYILLILINIGFALYFYQKY